MIIVVDYGVGNLASVTNMIRKVGGEVRISNNPDDVLNADKLLLPGVGHFDHGMKMLNSSGLRGALDIFAQEYKRPVLGICLGAQILGLSSEEGDSAGLGWIDMTCHRFEPIPGIRIPHMAWNQITLKKSSFLIEGFSENARFYFVHSYYMRCNTSSDVLATASHGIEFTCAFQRHNIIGTQFHPEKSLRHGMAFMKRFVDYQP